MIMSEMTGGSQLHTGAATDKHEEQSSFVVAVIAIQVSTSSSKGASNKGNLQAVALAPSSKCSQ
jgi:hypothetical protein